MMEHPGVGVCVYIEKDGKYLFGKRLSKWGRGHWCPPGGKLEMYEDVFEGARRETREEAGVEVGDLRLIGVVNDALPEYKAHFISLSFVSRWESGEVHLAEPDKFETWEWFPWDSRPEPVILAVRNLVDLGIDPRTAPAIPINTLRNSHEA